MRSSSHHQPAFNAALEPASWNDGSTGFDSRVGMMYSPGSRELWLNSRDREGVPFGRDLRFNFIPRIRPFPDFGIVVEFETHFLTGLTGDDIELVLNIECDLTLRIFGHIKFPFDLSDFASHDPRR